MVSFNRIAEITSQNQLAALCIVTETSGSTPRKAGSRMVVFHDGSKHGCIEGTIGGGAIEHRIRSEALSVIESGRAIQTQVQLTHDLGMCCGGQMTVFIEPLRKQPPCILLGAGHIGEVLCRLSAQAGFFVTIADPRREYLLPERLPHAHALVDNYSSVDLDKMPFGPDTFVVIVTHDHHTDQQLVEEVLTRPFQYAALVGSLRKAKLTKQRCLNKGICPEKINRLHCPAGINIGAETPEEIAFSIVAEMIQYRRGQR